MVGIFSMVAFERYKDKIEKATMEKEEEQSEVILFFSFDVVNSSEYKQVNYFGWSKVLNELFKELRRKVDSGIDGAELWRVLGDEIVFIVRIRKENDLFSFIKEIYKILLESVHELKNGKFFERLPQAGDVEIETMKAQNIISLQGTAWIALVSNNSNDGDNIFVKYETSEKYQIFEFLGNDIDTGFRISKQTRDSKLVISFELAYLLSRKTEELNKINIITYKELKGIWRNRLYPIIWYHDTESAGGKRLEETFKYDECLSNELVKEYYANRENEGVLKNKIHDTEMFKQVAVALNRILIDMNLESKVNKIVDGINKTKAGNKNYVRPSLLEMHCVAICFEPNTKKILIAKRTNERECIPGKWEFGCAKANLEKHLCDSIKEEYRADFGVLIEPCIQGERSDEEPVPIALYQLKKTDGLHKGVITLAKIIEEYDVDKFQSTKKHERVKWIEESEVDDFTEDAIDDFKNSLKEAFKKIKELDEDNGTR